MEQNFHKCMEEVYNKDGVTGCIVTDKSGLCLGVNGNASSQSAGVLTAMVDVVTKIEPASKPPIIYFQNESRQCLIYQNGPIIGAIFKATSV